MTRWPAAGRSRSSRSVAHRTTQRVVGEAWATERPLLTPVSRRVLARFEGLETLLPVPVPATSRPRLKVLGETVEVRPLAVYAELTR